MKPQQLATLLNIAPSTLRLWAGQEYAEFLSPNAVGINGAHRSFTEQDARILAWVALMRSQNMDPKDIVATLRATQAENWRGLPPLPGGIAMGEPIEVVPREAVEERLRALTEKYELQMQSLAKERDTLLVQNAELKAENVSLHARVMRIDDQLAELNKQLIDLLKQRQRRRK